MKTRFYLFVIALIFSLSQTAVLKASGGEAVVILAKAQDSFNTALKQRGEERRLNMLKAAGLFQSLERQFGVKNGMLYYNIGNAYYEAGDMGRAILNYRRAERFISLSDNLKHNLKQARKKLNLSQSKESWLTSMTKKAFFWHFTFSHRTRRLIFMISFSTVWLFLIWMIFQKNFLTRAGLIISLTAASAFGGSYLVSAYYNNVVESGVVVVDNVVARKGPGAGYQSFYQQPLSGGTEFELIEKQGLWAKAKLLNGDEVWLKIENIEMI